MNWIYLSPHLDDAALSCGGLIWEQSQAGDTVAVWTICAGDPSAGELSAFAETLHQRWGTGRDAVSLRRQEDFNSCTIINALPRHFSIPDCIYRQDVHTGRFLYAAEEAIMGPLDPTEDLLVVSLRQQIAQELPDNTQLVAPLALGGHVDHRLVRAAADRLDDSHRRLWYYQDYPYVLRCQQSLIDLRQSGWIPATEPVSAPGVVAWQAAVAAHTSQISTFWPDLHAMQAAVRDYWAHNGGVQLWMKPAGSIENQSSCYQYP